MDRAGHISLFAEVDETAARHAEKNEEAEREAAKKRRELEDQYRMRFVNAAGRDGAGLTDGKPWYSKGEAGTNTAPVEAPSVDAFGREDPGRKVRDIARMNVNDPLALMKKMAPPRRGSLAGNEGGRWRSERRISRLLEKEEEEGQAERRRRSGESSVIEAAAEVDRGGPGLLICIEAAGITNM